MKPVLMQVLAREQLLLNLKNVLSRHGAVPMSSSLVGFATAGTPSSAAMLLDRNSSVLCLRHEMRGPFAAWLARQVATPCLQNQDDLHVGFSCISNSIVSGVCQLIQSLPSRTTSIYLFHLC